MLCVDRRRAGPRRSTTLPHRLARLDGRIRADSAAAPAIRHSRFAALADRYEIGQGRRASLRRPSLFSQSHRPSRDFAGAVSTLGNPSLRIDGAACRPRRPSHERAPSDSHGPGREGRDLDRCVDAAAPAGRVVPAHAPAVQGRRRDRTGGPHGRTVAAGLPPGLRRRNPRRVQYSRRHRRYLLHRLCRTAARGISR